MKRKRMERWENSPGLQTYFVLYLLTVKKCLTLLCFISFFYSRGIPLNGDTLACVLQSYIAQFAMYMYVFNRNLKIMLLLFMSFPVTQTGTIEEKNIICNSFFFSFWSNHFPEISPTCTFIFGITEVDTTTAYIDW